MDGTSLNSVHCSPFQQWNDEHRTTPRHIVHCASQFLRSCGDSDSLEAHLLVLFNSVFHQVQSFTMRKKNLISDNKSRTSDIFLAFCPCKHRCPKQLPTFSKYLWASNHSRVCFLKSLTPWKNYLHPDFSAFVVEANGVLWNEGCCQFWGTSRWHSLQTVRGINKFLSKWHILCFLVSE